MTDLPTAIRDAVMGDHRQHDAVEAAAKAFLVAIDHAAKVAGLEPTERAREAAALDVMEHFLDKIIAEASEAG